MKKVFIKIVEAHQPSKSVVVKFASEHSIRPIDEYDGLAFTVTNFLSLNPQEFIDSIRHQIEKLVTERDRAEQATAEVDVTAWQGYSTTISIDDVNEIDPEIQNQLIPGLINPEVIL